MANQNQTIKIEWENLPIAITHSKYFDAYNSCMEELEIDAGDYAFRQGIKGWNKKYHQFLMLELKQYIKNRFTDYCGELKVKYNGACYKYKYLKPTNKKIKGYYNATATLSNGNVIRNNINEYSGDWLRYTNIPAVRQFYKNETEPKKEGEPEWKEPTQKEFEEWCNTKRNQYTSRKNREELNNNLQLESDKPTEDCWIKVKYCYKKRDYTAIRLPYYSVLNFKKWSATTGKSSLKGLKADTTWTYTNSSSTGRDRTSGWTFGGTSADDMRTLAKWNNYPEVKGKKAEYGDYAKWIWKTLM